MQEHFSINRAASLLERTQRTVKRALRDTPPDSHERGQPRWRLARIVSALERNAARPANHGGGSGDQLAECDAAFKEFDRRFDKMKAEPSLAKRRKLARSMAPLIARTIRLMRARDTACGLHPDHADLRGDKMFLLVMLGFEEPCAWTKSEVWENLDTSGHSDDDAA